MAKKKYYKKKLKKYRKKYKGGKKKYKKKKCIMTLPKQLIPKRAFIVHKFVRYIRIPSRFEHENIPPTPVNANWNLPGWGRDYINDDIVVPCNKLYISCNSPMNLFNQEATPSIPGTNVPLPNTPAFLNGFDADQPQIPLNVSQCLFDFDPRTGGPGTGVPPVGSLTGYINQYPSFWRQMCSFYNQYTVVGSKVKIKFCPDQLVPVRERNLQHCVFTLGIQQTRETVSPKYEPQLLQEAPGFTSREFVGTRPEFGGKPYVFSMTKKWSAKKNMGFKKGGIIGNDAISGNREGKPTPYLTGENTENQVANNTSAGSQTFNEQWATFPRHQQYYVLTCNSALTNNSNGAFEASKYPSGLLKIEYHASTVWHAPRNMFNNEQLPSPPVPPTPPINEEVPRL